MPNPLVTIGIPVYNGEKWIRFTAESILTQTFTDLELVIVDNASSDRTHEICSDLCTADARVRYIRNSKNIGVFRNYDACFQNSNSQYFKWCAVGDCCDETFIQKAIMVMEEDPDVVLVHSRTGLIGDAPTNAERYEVELNIIDSDPTVRFRDYLNRVRLNNIMNGLIRTADLSHTCLHRPFHSSDKCMVAELALRGKLVELPEELLFRRMEVATATALKSEEEKRQFFADEPSSPSVLWRWKSEITLLKGVLRSPASVTAKLRLLVYMIKRLFWQRADLSTELLGYFRTK